MKKVLVKCLVLTCLLTPMNVSKVFASVSQSYQQQQLELIRQQNEALKQQTDYLRQQVDALKQNQTTVQGQVYYQPAPVYTQPPVYTTPMYVQTPVYYHQAYNPGPWYGGLAAGYILGNWSRCGHWWGGGCGRCWR